MLRRCSYLFVIVWCAASYLDKIVWHHFLNLLNECGYITDTERSMNCSRNSVFDLPTFVLLFAQAVPRIYPHIPSLSQTFGA